MCSKLLNAYYIVGTSFLSRFRDDEQMTSHNVGALLVVKSGSKEAIAGIVTERGKRDASSLS